MSKNSPGKCYQDNKERLQKKKKKKKQLKDIKEKKKL